MNFNYTKIREGINAVGNVLQGARAVQAAMLAQEIASSVITEYGFANCIVEIEGQRVALGNFVNQVNPVPGVAPVMTDSTSAYKFMDLYRIMDKLSRSSGINIRNWNITGERYNCCLRIRYERTDVMTFRFEDKHGESVSAMGGIMQSYVRVAQARIGGRDSYYISPKDAKVIDINTRFSQINWESLDTHGEEIRDVLIDLIESKKFL